MSAHPIPKNLRARRIASVWKVRLFRAGTTLEQVATS